MFTKQDVIGGIDVWFWAPGPGPEVQYTVPASTMVPRAHPIVTIFPDGRIELGPNVTLDEAAEAFWNAVREHAPR